jgi:hypothetical protein
MKRIGITMVAGVLVAAAACGDSGRRGPTGEALPADCQGRCPTGWRCDDGVCVGGDPAALALDVETVPLSGVLTVDGRPPVATSGCAGDHVRIRFTEGPLPKGWFDPVVATLLDARIACGVSTGTFSTRLPAGKYRVLASRSDSSTTFPDATFVVDGAFSPAAGAPPVAWDVTTVPVSGRLTVDGRPPEASSSCAGDQVRLTFVDARGATFTSSIDCGVSDGSFSARVAPGTYRVLASRSDSSTTFPDATFVVDGAFTVSGPATGLAWDLTTVAVSGRLTVDGRAPAATSACVGDHVRIAFTDQAGATFTSKIACSVSDGSFSARVAPGTYRVLASRSDSNTSFPDATMVVERALGVTAPTSGLSFALTTVPVTGTITIDGRAPSATSSCSGDHVRVSFVDEAGAVYSARIPCGVSTGAFSARVAPGTYRVLASRSDSSSTFPDATITLARGLRVEAATPALALDLATVPVSGRLTVDGRAPSATSSCSGDHVRVALLDGDGAIFSTRIPCGAADGRFAGRVVPGTYRVIATRTDSSSTFLDGTVTLVNALTIRAPSR